MRNRKIDIWIKKETERYEERCRERKWHGEKERERIGYVCVVFKCVYVIERVCVCVCVRDRSV